MLDSVIAKVESMGKKDKQDGRLKFAARNNNEYNWSLNEEALIEDNTPEEYTTTHRGIPAEMPGVTMEQDLPAIVEPEENIMPHPNQEDI